MTPSVSRRICARTEGVLIILTLYIVEYAIWPKIHNSSYIKFVHVLLCLYPGSNKKKSHFICTHIRSRFIGHESAFRQIISRRCIISFWKMSINDLTKVSLSMHMNCHSNIHCMCVSLPLSWPIICLLLFQ